MANGNGLCWWQFCTHQQTSGLLGLSTIMLPEWLWWYYGRHAKCNVKKNVLTRCGVWQFREDVVDTALWLSGTNFEGGQWTCILQFQLLMKVHLKFDDQGPSEHTVMQSLPNNISDKSSPGIWSAKEGLQLFSRTAWSSLKKLSLVNVFPGTASAGLARLTPSSRNTQQ
jgi:hypothetical protein